MKYSIEDVVDRITKQPRTSLAQLPTPLHRLVNYSRLLGIDLWMKRDDLTGLAGGGNKTRKLEFLVGDALSKGADTLVTIGALQSNHTRQTAAAAARSGLHCVLLHSGWTRDAGEFYRETGNLLLSSLMGAELYVDETPRPIDDQSPLVSITERLIAEGRKVYAIPGGASEHPLGSLGYMVCAVEIAEQGEALGRPFDYILHCTGSSSTQAGLLAGLRAIGSDTRVVGIADDEETELKSERVLQLANDTLALLGIDTRVVENDVTVLAADKSPYGVADERTLDSIRQFAAAEGLIADPVYEGKAVRGLRDLAEQGYFATDARVLLMHLGGTPAVHAYANQLGIPELHDIHDEE